IPVGDRREVRLGHVQLRNVRTTRNALLDREGEISMRAGFEVARRGDLTTPERPPFGKSLAVENDESAIGERGFGDSHVRSGRVVATVEFNRRVRGLGRALAGGGSGG